MTSHINLNMLRFLCCYGLYFTHYRELFRASLGLTTQHDSQVHLCFSLLLWRRCLDTIRMSRQLPVTTARHPASGETPNFCQSPLFLCAQILDHFTGVQKSLFAKVS